MYVLKSNGMVVFETFLLCSEVDTGVGYKEYTGCNRICLIPLSVDHKEKMLLKLPICISSFMLTGSDLTE